MADGFREEYVTTLSLYLVLVCTDDWLLFVIQTAVSVNQWSTYHSADNFRDPDLFIPERFMGDERFASDKRSALQPFHIGPRNCLGRK